MSFTINTDANGHSNQKHTQRNKPYHVTSYATNGHD